ncbi:glycine N-acyltransferase-like protein Keg1 [Physella acuta]|uniref:glycine N-acyltransferase-like protein Keg1 n=1 Tax=Physella acuta TaxID=109671 RepID=UPI0027DE4B79|nr:glycine N-acyltransferase-like protein Keg1 [Physella acuta]XP_059172795.1 glycine N-acyltransferase-like protein Keg1 [Physella acuta]
MSVMFHILTTEETQDLKLQLHLELPGSAKIYYILCNHLDNLLKGFEVVVDQWPQWNCLLLRPQNNDLVPSYFRHYYMCHTRSIKDFKFFIQRPSIVDWTKPAIFTGVPYDVVGLIQEKSRKELGVVTSVEHRFMYAWIKPEPPQPAVVPDHLELTVLKKDHAETVCDHWKHYRTNDGLVEYFRQVIEHFENSAIITKDGRLVAYICMQFNGSMANLFVDPEFHSENLGVILLRDLTRKLLAKHQTVYGFIKTKDSSFITTCQSIGFSWVPQGSMSWVHYQPRSVIINDRIPKVPSSSKISENGSHNDYEHPSKEKDLFLNALPLSCNECSGIPAIGKSACVHVSIS